jgi:hypothetical protein
MSLESLVNKGVITLNLNNIFQQKTIIVVGVARGGTSIVAGSLKHLGLFMGNASDPVFEDTRLSLAFEKQSKEKFEAVIADYNNKHDIWAWKRPSSLNELPHIAKKLRNPHFIFVFRDLLSVANRNKISMKHGLVGSLEAAFNDYKKIVNFIKKTSHPALLVSSEKTVKYKENFIGSLIAFADLKPTAEQIEQANAFISLEPISYLKVSRIDCVTGWVDAKKMQTGLLFGWAYQAHNKSTVELSVFVNGELLKTISASDYCQNFKGKIHPTGKCAFSLNLAELGVKPNDLIEVKPEGDEVNVCGIEIDLSHLQTWLTAEQADKSTTPKGAVNLNVLQTGLLRGWALSHRPDTPARVGVYINGEKYAEVPASIIREHLKKPNIHPTGACGYDFNLKLFGIKPSDELEVKLEGLGVVLFQRKQMFPELSDWLTHEELKQQNEQAKNAS